LLARTGLALWAATLIILTLVRLAMIILCGATGLLGPIRRAIRHGCAFGNRRGGRRRFQALWRQWVRA
jgi:hypothetical protein